MKLEKMRNKVSVVGGGLGGLATAALLANEGFEVTLYEKTRSVGGRGISKKIREYILDNGVHAFRGADDGAAARVMQKLGKKIEFATKYSDGVLPLWYMNGTLIEMPLDIPKLLKNPELITSDESLGGPLYKLAWKTRAEDIDDMSVIQWLKKCALDNNQDAVAFFKSSAALGYYCEPDLEKISAGEIVRFLQANPYDVGFPLGGWKQVIDKLMQSIEENGGKIITGKAVKQVLFLEEQRLMGKSLKAVGLVLDNGEKVDASSVVLNVPLTVVQQMIPKRYLSEQFTTFLKDYETSAGIVIDLVASGEIIAGKHEMVTSLDPVAVLRVSTKYDHTLAPIGQNILTAWMPIKNVKPEERLSYINAKYAELEQIVEKIFPGVLTKAIFKRKMAFDTVIGAYPKISQTRPKRPSVTMANIDNLYLVGDAINVPTIGGSSDAAFNSAMQCAELISHRLPRISDRMPSEDIRNSSLLTEAIP